MTENSTPVIRITELRARPGLRGKLVHAAHGNAAAARQAAGCRSAEVCTTPGDEDRVSVISRWESEQAVQAFLRWHRSIAHESLAEFSLAAPESVHHTVVPAEG